MTRTPSRAALKLLEHGYTSRKLADELGVTPQAVSFQLTGQAAETSPRLLELLHRRLGDTLAGEVLDLINAERERRAAS